MILPKKTLRNIFIIFDETMLLSLQVNSISKSAFFISETYPGPKVYLSRTATERLIHNFVTSKLDSCNSLLYAIIWSAQVFHTETPECA